MISENLDGDINLSNKKMQLVLEENKRLRDEAHQNYNRFTSIVDTTEALKLKHQHSVTLLQA